MTENLASPAHRRPGSRRSVLVALAAVSALTLVACTGGAPSKTNSTDGSSGKYTLSATTPAPSGNIDSFSWALYAEPGTLSFPFAVDFPEETVLSNVCDTLLRWNSDLSQGPGIATSWTQPTPEKWVYQIRQGVKFHDGTVLTADDVVASLRQHIDPKVGSYFGIVYSDVKSIEKTGPSEVTVTSSKPAPLFNQYMAMTAGTIESAATLEKDGANYGNPTTGVNCSGPFQLDKWTPGQGITLKRFDDYWDSTLKAKAAAVDFKFLQDPTTRVNALLTGAVDGGWQVPSDAIAKLTAGGSGKLYFGVNTEVDVEIPTLNGVLGNVDVRRALLTAIDREGVVAAGENGYGEVTNSLTAQSLWHAQPKDATAAAFSGLKPYSYDVKAASAMVKDAGVQGKKLVIATSAAQPNFGTMTQAVAAAATAIGLVPEIKTITPDQYTALFSDPKALEGIDIFAADWGQSLADPDVMFTQLKKGSPFNYGGWDNPTHDSLTLAAETEMDPAKRAALYVQIQQIENDQLPWLPIYQKPEALWLGKRITGPDPSINFTTFPWAAKVGAL